MLYIVIISGMLLATYNAWLLPLEKYTTPNKQHIRSVANQRTRLLLSLVTDDNPAWRGEDWRPEECEPAIKSPVSPRLGAFCWLKIACCGATFAVCVCCSKVCCCCCKKDCCD